MVGVTKQMFTANYCCMINSGSSENLNKCDDKYFCCPKDRNCINYSAPKTQDYNPKKDIMLYIFGSILIFCFIVFLVRILHKLFTMEHRTTNQITEQGSNNQSNTSIHHLPSYSQLCFQNTNFILHKTFSQIRKLFTRRKHHLKTITF